MNDYSTIPHRSVYPTLCPLLYGHSVLTRIVNVCFVFTWEDSKMDVLLYIVSASSEEQQHEFVCGTAVTGKRKGDRRAITVLLL